MGELCCIFWLKWGLGWLSLKAFHKLESLRRPQMDYARIASKLREKIIKFLGELLMLIILQLLNNYVKLMLCDGKIY